MKEPTFDADGYPTEATLRAIRKWPITVPSDTGALLDFVGRAWSYPNYWRKAKNRHRSFGSMKRKYTVSTGGWSGNESLIGALRRNYLFWGIAWVSERRGGHFEFETYE